MCFHTEAMSEVVVVLVTTVLGAVVTTNFRFGVVVGWVLAAISIGVVVGWVVAAMSIGVVVGWDTVGTVGWVGRGGDWGGLDCQFHGGWGRLDGFLEVRHRPRPQKAPHGGESLGCCCTENNRRA
ncbi:unnamed protein product [Closterium sp. NIES-54]